MIDTYLLHDDYEDFAEKYLGIDYDDYIELLNEFELCEGELEISL